MRALVVHPGPAFSVADVYNGWVKGLRQNGVETVSLNFDDRLDFYARHPSIDSPQDAALLAAKGIEVACYEFQPDVVVIVSGFYIPPTVLAIIRSRGAKVMMLHTESPYEDDRQIQRARFADVNIVNDPTNLDQFPEGSVYLPHCYDPDQHFPRPVKRDAASDFCFVGTGFQSRIEFFEKVDWSGIDAAFAGNWQATDPRSPIRDFLAHDVNECCPNDQTAVLYTSTKVSANLYRKEATHDADGWAMGPREVELAACGTFYLREPRPEGDDLLWMLPTFTDPGDFGDQLRWWLNHDDARTEAARKAREAVADRTFRRNAAAALELLGV